MVPQTGIEPVRCHHRGILSPVRLPISPPRHDSITNDWTAVFNLTFKRMARYQIFAAFACIVSKKSPTQSWAFRIRAWRCPTFTWQPATLSSALSGFTSEFEMGSGGSRSLCSPSKLVWLFCSRHAQVLSNMLFSLCLCLTLSRLA
jgi:hypothetical protein